MSEKKNCLASKKIFIFDMDGTIYLGNNPFPAAIKFINRLRESGRKVLFFTNNASHNHEFYLEKLNRLGFGAGEDEIMSSADVTIEFLLRNRSDKKVYLLGTDELYQQMKNAGVNLMCTIDGKIIDGLKADIVVSSFDTSLNYEKLTIGCDFVRYGAEYLSTHPDYNCPTETGFIPDSGAIAAAITASTGVAPRYFGKPYADTVSMICEITGVDREDMCIFGDRLYTDIATGKKHGMTAVLVLTGESTLEDVEKANADERPDVIFKDMTEAEAAVFN